MRADRIVVMAWVLLAAAGAWGAEKKGENRDREALRRAQLVQQKMEREKAALQEELQKTRDQTESYKRAAGRSDGKVAELRKELDAANQEKDGLRAKLDEAGRRAAEADRRIGELERERAKLGQEKADTAALLAQQTGRAVLCEDNNARLYRIGQELVGHYRQRGLWSRLLENEPFTRIKSVEMENLLEDYQDKFESQHIAKPSP